MAIGTLDPGANATIGFEVVIGAPLPAGVTLVSNQAMVSSDELPTILTDDPDTPTAGDATNTTLGEPDPGGDGPSRSEFDALASRVSELEANEATQQAKLDALMDQVMSLENDLSALSERVGELEEGDDPPPPHCDKRPRGWGFGWPRPRDCPPRPRH